MSGNVSIVSSLGIAGREKEKGDTTAAASKSDTKTEAKIETKSSDAKAEVGGAGGGGGGGGEEKKKNRGKQTDVILNSKIDDFRALIKSLAFNQKKSVPDYLHNILDDFTTTGEDKIKVLTFDHFENGMSKVKGLTAKLFKADLRQIFDEIEDLSLKGNITVDKIVAFCQKNIPIVRTMALKLRQGITEKYTNEAGYRKLFDTMTVNKSKFADLDQFLNVADDVLDRVIDVSDGHDLYMLFDMDGDGQVSVDDFIGFLMGNTALEGMNALKSGNQDAIVDVKISVSPEQETELQRCGYHCVIPTAGTSAGRVINGGAAISQGTFGRGQSMWIWRRSQVAYLLHTLSFILSRTYSSTHFENLCYQCYHNEHFSFHCVLLPCVNGGNDNRACVLVVSSRLSTCISTVRRLRLPWSSAVTHVCLSWSPTNIYG